MNKTLFVFVALTAFSGLANADQLCGKLTGYCGNGWCEKSITPTYCLNGGDTCRDGAPVKVVADDSQALTELNRLLEQGDGTRVCATGTRAEDGVFHAESAVEEDPAPAASASYELRCDDDSIFETPLVIRVRGGVASATGDFSGPGDAIFNIRYPRLFVLPQLDGAFSIVQPHVVGTQPGFSLELHAMEGNRARYSGELKVVSTDSDRMPYSGRVSCVRR